MISIKHEDFSDNYDLFVKLCDITTEPLRLTKEGQPDLIVMNKATFERRKKMLDLKEKFLKINQSETSSPKGISLEELSRMINEIEKEAL